MASKLSNLSRLLHQSSARCNISNNNSTLPENIREGFKIFQRDDGVPVYLKGGRGDKILLQITVVLTAIGLSNAAYTIYRLDRKH